MRSPAAAARRMGTQFVFPLALRPEQAVPARIPSAQDRQPHRNCHRSHPDQPQGERAVLLLLFLLFLLFLPFRARTKSCLVVLRSVLSRSLACFVRWWASASCWASS